MSMTKTTKNKGPNQDEQLGPLKRTCLLPCHHRDLFEIFPHDLEEVRGASLEISLLVKGDGESQNPFVALGFGHVFQDLFAGDGSIRSRLVGGGEQDVHGFISRGTEPADGGV